MNPLDAWGWTAHWAAAFESIRRGELEPARVIEEQKHIYEIAWAGGIARAETSGRLRHEARGRQELPAVGDWVAALVRPGESRATLHGVLPRRTSLVRKDPAPGRSDAQVVAANVDTVFLVTSLNQEFSPRRLERYLAMLWESGAQPVLLLNKSDLCADPEPTVAHARRAAGEAPVHVLSARRGDGVDALGGYLRPGSAVALVGSSGVGKSTLVNRLYGEAVQRVHEIRSDDDTGRHTTTFRRLVRLESGALLVDTPGLRELALWDHAAGLEAAFQDIDVLATQCRFRNCTHNGEPGCAVGEAIDTGDLDPDRLRNYGQLLREQAHIERKRDKRAQHEERVRRRKFARSIRRRKPRR